MTGKKIHLDEIWTLRPDSAGDRCIARMLRRGRAVVPPRGLASGEDYRQWLFELAQERSVQDETEHERLEATAWIARIKEAKEAELWAEYQERRRPGDSAAAASAHVPQHPLEIS